MIFPYIKRKDKTGKILYKPLLNIFLTYPKGHRLVPYPIEALVDSGADYCLANKDIGRWLKINFKKKKTKEFLAASNTKFLGWPERMKICLSLESTLEFITDVYFVENCPVGIILGQTGFFDNFRVTFERYNNYFVIEKK